MRSILCNFLFIYFILIELNESSKALNTYNTVYIDLKSKSSFPLRKSLHIFYILFCCVKNVLHIIGQIMRINFKKSLLPSK